MQEILRYTIGGVSSSIAEYLAYIASLHVLHAGPYISVVIGFIVSTIVSFIFNNYLVYKTNLKGKEFIEGFIKNFMTYFGTGIILKEILQYVFINILLVSENYSLIIILIIIAPLNYLLTKFWVFK